MESKTNSAIPDPRDPQNRDENGAVVTNKSDAGQQLAANGKNKNEAGEKRDEGQSYVDYNGNSEANNPARAE